MRIHNDALLRVVFASRLVGGLMSAGGLALAALAFVSFIRHPENDFPWMRLISLTAGAILPGLLLIIFSAILDRGRVRAFYVILTIAVVEVLMSSTFLLMSMNYRNVIALVPAVALAVACGIAWEPARSLRHEERKASSGYAPLKPIASTAVVIPPPPARKQTIRETQDSSDDSGNAMVIEIRRA